MKQLKRTTVLIPILFIILSGITSAQKVGFISSETIRKHFIEAKQAEQRVQSIVEEWKRELAATQMQIENLEFEIRKNRLIWTDTERITKERELQELIINRERFAKLKFEAGGEYDNIVKQVMKPIEEKIYAAVQEVSSREGYDIIWDQSVNPLAYVNFKYDITVKVLRRLGVDVAELEKDLEQKIKNDPRNEPQETTQRPRRRSRSQSDGQTPTSADEPNEKGDPANDPSIDVKDVPRPVERRR